jgi:hypothetical protein
MNEASTTYHHPIADFEVTITSPTTGRVKTLADVTVNRQLARVDAEWRVRPHWQDAEQAHVYFEYGYRPFARVYEAGHQYEGLTNDGLTSAARHILEAAATEAIEAARADPAAELAGRRAALQTVIDLQEREAEQLKAQLVKLNSRLCYTLDQRARLEEARDTLEVVADEVETLAKVEATAVAEARADVEKTRATGGSYFDLERSQERTRTQLIDAIQQSTSDQHRSYQDECERAARVLRPELFAYVSAYKTELERLREEEMRAGR